ncbi:MAG: cytochrome b/b6 domain-containing protein [Xanthomonadales bacterium]|nr:cytochrome b/b6 domain-containing protein [Xanthomonadales bacterium]
MTELREHAVWDAGTRWFHWINFLCVLILMFIGLVIFNAGSFDLSNAGKIQFKTLHAWVGYVFALNLLWRFAWAFFGNRYARWRSILPGGRGYLQALHRYLSAFAAGRPEPYAGHNPAARLGIGLLLLLLTVQAVTGLVLAGTVVLHVAAAVITEIREGGSIVSAMFTGRKIIAGQPVDQGGSDAG